MLWNVLFFLSPLHLSTLEWLPKSFRSPNAKETNVVSVTCNGRVEMLEKNITAPFKFLRGINTFIFSLKVIILSFYPLFCIWLLTYHIVNTILHTSAVIIQPILRKKTRAISVSQKKFFFSVCQSWWSFTTHATITKSCNSSTSRTKWNGWSHSVFNAKSNRIWFLLARIHSRKNTLQGKIYLSKFNY